MTTHQSPELKEEIDHIMDRLLGRMKTIRHEFETRSLPRSLAPTRRGFAFYVADPLSSIHEFRRNGGPIDSSLRRFVTIRVISVFLAIVACAISCALSNAQESPPAQTPSLSSPSISPDKKWEYRVEDDGSAVLVRARSDKPVVRLSNPDTDGSLKGETGKLVWAPDSRRVAFNYQSGGKYYSCDVYELAGTKWKKLPQLEKRAAAVKKLMAHAKQTGLKESGVESANPIEDLWRVRRWLDNDTFEALAYSEGSFVAKGSGQAASLITGVLFTVKCDNRGSWNITGTRELNEGEAMKMFEESETEQQ
jgi:hypothetical protein